jgi:muconolactone D-isomerase
MLFQIEMNVKLPADMPESTAADIKAREKSYSQGLQHQGIWSHLWRISGSYANIRIFDVADNTELHELISRLPLFPYMDIRVTPLCHHHSSTREDDR